MWNLKKLVRLVGVMGLLVRLVEEPAVNLAVGGVEGSMFHEQVHLGHQIISVGQVFKKVKRW